jgi:hypothetical protein
MYIKPEMPSLAKRQGKHPRKETDFMDTSSETPASAHETDLLPITSVTRGREPMHRFTGYYDQFEDIPVESPLACEWIAQPETTGVNLQGHLSGVLVLDCPRCLEPCPVPVTIDIDEHFVFSSFVESYDKERELQAEDYFEVVGEEDTLDLKDLVHQFLVIEMQSRGTCGRPGCRFPESESRPL